MNSENTQETWQVEANGMVCDTNFAEMTSWIDNGMLGRTDKVRKGNLRWIEAGKVPSLISVFNAKDHGQPVAPVITATLLAPSQLAGNSTQNPINVESEISVPAQNHSTGADVCAMHSDVPAAFVCDTCANRFCKVCPNSYGGTVKICPFCGAMCKPVAQAAVPDHSPQFSRAAPLGEGLGSPISYRLWVIRSNSNQA
ncbi:MAG: hypothetical protein IPG67_15485 [Acidobacteria bacterium]|nr:hypothetical protein [Acidobacteriota bacterium]